MIDKLPHAYPFWAKYAQDKYDETVATIRQDMPDNQPMTWQQRKIAIDAAENEIQLVIVQQTKGLPV
jgi:hypothetical protein